MGESTDQSRHDVHLSLTEDRLAVLFSGAVPEAQRRELVDAITDELAVLGVAVIPSKAVSGKFCRKRHRARTAGSAAWRWWKAGAAIEGCWIE